MPSLKTAFVLVIAVVAIGLYCAGVWSAGRHSLDGTPARMSTFLLQIVTVVGAALAANFGAFAGIDVPTAVRRGRLPARSDVSLGTWVRGIGALVFFVSLLVSLWFWSQTGWQEDPAKIVRTVPEQSRMLVGVIAGGLALAFTLE